VIPVLEGEDDALVTGSELVVGIESLVASFGARDRPRGVVHAANRDAATTSAIRRLFLTS